MDMRHWLNAAWLKMRHKEDMARKESKNSNKIIEIYLKEDGKYNLLKSFNIEELNIKIK